MIRVLVITHQPDLDAHPNQFLGILPVRLGRERRSKEGGPANAGRTNSVQARAAGAFAQVPGRGSGAGPPSRPAETGE